MPNEPIISTLLDELAAKLEVMSKRRGYWHDYGGVIRPAYADFDMAREELFPICMAHEGEIPRGGEQGGESSGNAYRTYDGVPISVAFSAPGCAEATGNRIRADLHRALLSGDNRCFDASSYARISQASIEIQYAPETGGAPSSMGLVVFDARIWHLHTFGDMTA